MDQRERQVIDELFAKLRQVDQQAPQRDPEAEAYIRQQLANLPSAPYYMAQAMLVQEHALGGLQQRVQELERQLAERPAGGGGFLSGLFGGQSSTPAAPAQRSTTPRPNPFGHGATTAPGMAGPGMMGAGMGSPWGGRPGGGFLAGAMQTALGVAGGMLVADALMSAFDGGAAQASELAQDAGFGDAAATDEPPAEAQDAGYEQDMSEADTGGDFGEEI